MAEQFTLELDKPRLSKQLEVVREVMLSAGSCGTWLTLAEIARTTGYPPASVSADLRHLRNGRHAGDERYEVRKRRRGEPGAGIWEYQVTRKVEAT